MIRDHRSSAHPFVGLPPLHAKQGEKKKKGARDRNLIRSTAYCALLFAAALGSFNAPVPASVCRLSFTVEFSTICLPVRPANSAPACRCATTVRPVEVLNYPRKGTEGERERSDLSRAALYAGRRECYTVAINKGLR